MTRRFNYEGEVLMCYDFWVPRDTEMFRAAEISLHLGGSLAKV